MSPSLVIYIYILPLFILFFSNGNDDIDVF